MQIVRFALNPANRLRQASDLDCVGVDRTQHRDHLLYIDIPLAFLSGDNAI